MIRWLLSNQRQINGVERGEVGFHFAGPKLKPQWRVVEQEITVV